MTKIISRCNFCHVLKEYLLKTIVYYCGEKHINNNYSVLLLV